MAARSKTKADAAERETWKKSDMAELLREYSEAAAAQEAERRARKKLKPVEGQPFWPHEMIRNTVIFCVFTAATILVSAALPYFLEAPADPRGPPAVILPDWYLLWSYGLLKITDDITICGGWSDLAIAGFEPCGKIISLPVVGPLNAKMWGLLMNAVVVLPLVVLPFIDRGHSRRPVESPGMASFAMAWTVYIFMISVYSINNVINEKWPVFGKEYLVWTRDYVTLFQLDLLALLTNLLPIAAFFLTYIPLKIVQKQHGYEAKLNANYYKVR